ncbi:PHD [Musa troglodytarum]|uniref:PHD n=1 Tax=Musa troglodytarum TaxID=320322 RepID=A0A9E7GCJ7_9LILI|nr:PHD [Musa troglodytarum]
MGDEGHAKAPAEEPPATKKRARDGGDLKRVAEIVMVLSAMGQMRGGRQPTAAEKALVAEARERLVAMCEGVKPKELFSGEAVRVVVEDLGLNRSKDPVMGFRPPKMSIADRLLLTKKKIEESKAHMQSSVCSPQHLPVSFGAKSDIHGTLAHDASRFMHDRSPMGTSAGGSQSASLITRAPLLTSAAPSLKQPHLNDVQAGVSSVNKLSGPLERGTPSAHIGLNARLNGPSYLTQDQAENVSQKIPTISSVQSTSAAVVKFGQANKLPDHISVKSEGALGVNAVKTSHQMMINHETKPSMMQAGQGTLHIVHQPSQGLTVVHTPALFTNHNDIAKSIQRILQANISDHPIWTPPSTEYMNSTLNCQVCKNAITDIESLLVCDACEKGNHLKCLQSYGNKGIPKAEWHCPRCLASSNGKPLPPKYGRVTRAPIGAPKATSNASIHASSKKTENLDKVNQQKAIPSAISGVSQHAYSLNEEGKHHDPVPDSRTSSPEVQVTLTAVGDKRANETCNLIGCNNLKEVSGSVCTPPGTHCEDTNNIEDNILSLAGTKPTAESVLQPSTASENSCEHSHDMDVENNHLSKVPFSHNFDQMKLPSDGKSPANELDKDAKLAMTKPEEALGEKNLPENIDACNARLANEGSTQSTADRDGYTMNQKANLG